MLTDTQRFDTASIRTFILCLWTATASPSSSVCLPHAKERLQSFVFHFPPEMRCTDSHIECDAQTGNRYILSYLDGNIARLLRFKQATLSMVQN